MDILKILEHQEYCDILDLLLENSASAERISSITGVGLECINERLSVLEESGAIIKKEKKYEIVTLFFEMNMERLMKYAYISEQSENDSETGKSLYEHLFLQREENFEHASFDREVAFYESICTGDIERVKLLATPLCSSGYGVLSPNALRNLKYHFVVSVAMITRFCINSGMTPEEAYNLSDVYIMKADSCKEENEIHQIHYEMMISFTKRMRNVKNSNIYSKQVIKAIDYISEHLHDKIRIQDVVDYLSLSVPYFSRLFKAETGVTFSEYVTIKKVEVASNMIRFSGGSTLEISNILNFSSQSYFIKVFKKYTGMTPNEYKKKYNFFGDNLLERALNKNGS